MPDPHAQDRFLRLLDEHRRILFKVANAYARDAAERDDLVQETALQLWRSFARYDESQRFSTWMYRIALNVAISSSRRESRRPRHEPDGEALILEVAAGADQFDDAADGAARSEDLARLHRFIGGLGELDRALVLLHLDEHDHASIAAVLGITKSNVGTRLGRIKERLRREWLERPIPEGTHGTR